MKFLRPLACGFLLVVFSVSLLAELFAPASYATQFREADRKSVV